jgi:hypothetical protein
MGLGIVMKTRAMMLAPQDNVAIALTDLEAGLELDLRSEGHLFHAKLKDPFPTSTSSVSPVPVSEDHEG